MSALASHKDIDGANKTAAYALTPVWLAGSLALLEVLPGTSLLYRMGMLSALVYSIFIGIWAVPMLLGTPKNKAVGHVLSAVGIGIAALAIVIYSVFWVVDLLLP